MDTTVIPPPGVDDAATVPCSLPSLGSALAPGHFCPECDRDLLDRGARELVLCETCVDTSILEGATAI